MKGISAVLMACAAGCAAQATVAAAQTERVLYSFCSQQSCADGQDPRGGMIKVDGKLFGTTSSGGAGNAGTVFALNPRNGALSVAHAFGGADDGAAPFAGLLKFDNMLFGTAQAGGDSDVGVVYSLDPKSGAETVLYSLGGTNGADPQSNLIHIGSLLYGTTQYGGDSSCGGGVACGAIFALDPETGAETVLHSFEHGGGGDGAFPRAGLVHIKNMLYGTTFAGGNGDCFNGGGCGTVFSFDLKTGRETVLHYFQSGSGDGASPQATLTNVGGVLYGTTTYGGAGSCYSGCGAVFSIDPATGTETVIYAFQGNGADGAYPEAALIDVDGVLYGATAGGGAYGGGTVFSIDPGTGAETALHSFPIDATDGNTPVASLLDENGVLYGTTLWGGANGDGTVFAITP